MHATSLDGVKKLVDRFQYRKRSLGACNFKIKKVKGEDFVSIPQAVIGCMQREIECKLKKSVCFNTASGHWVHAALCPGALVGQALKMGFWSRNVIFDRFCHFRTWTSFQFSLKNRLQALPYKAFRCPRQNRSGFCAATQFSRFSHNYLTLLLYKVFDCFSILFYAIPFYATKRSKPYRRFDLHGLLRPESISSLFHAGNSRRLLKNRYRILSSDIDLRPKF